MTKLEQAVKQIEAEMFASGKFTKKTISELAKESLNIKISAIKSQQYELEENFVYSMKSLEKQKENLLAASQMLNGKAGFFRCTQGTFDIESGFTAFEEIIEKLNTYGVTCSLTPLKCWIGQEVYSVSENGMMHISARKVDSSD